MKITFKILFVFLLTGSSVAQSLVRKLTGYWETNENRRDSSLLFAQSGIRSQSIYFLTDHHFQRNIIWNSGKSVNDTLIYNSKFKCSFNRKQILVSNKNYILKNSAKLNAVDKFKSSLTFISDTSFVLLNNMYVRRPGTTIPIFDLPAPRLNSFYIQNTLKNSRKIRVPSKKVQLQIDESNAPGEHLSRINTTECQLDSIFGDSMSVTLYSEEVEVEHRNKFVSLSTSYYAGSFNKVSKHIAKRDLLYLNMRNPFRQTMYNIASVIMGAAIITIVSSPLCGTRLQGDQRAAVRNKVFTLGVTGFAISIPFFIVGKNKKYVLSPSYKTSSNNYWTLKQN